MKSMTNLEKIGSTEERNLKMWGVGVGGRHRVLETENRPWAPEEENIHYCGPKNIAESQQRFVELKKKNKKKTKG